MIETGVLNSEYQLTQTQLDFYRQNAFIKLREVLPDEVIIYFNSVISEKVNELNKTDTPLDKRDTYGKAFLQLFNLWREDEKIRELVYSKRLAKIASDLMGVEGVRLYHDQALYKEAGGGITPWHADQYYWPLTTDKTITIWIPLQATSLEMGPIEFGSGSHKMLKGRELAISDESENIIDEKLKVDNFKQVIEPFDIGEVSFHSGWIFHRAGANTTKEVRKIMTIIYMDKAMLLKEPINSGQKKDWDAWCPGAEIGKTIDTPLNPILYERN